MKQETKKKVFLALTELHRSMEKGDNIAWISTFKKHGVTSPNTAINIKKCLLDLKLIAVKGRKMGWNKQKTLPSMILIDQIERMLKEAPIKRVCLTTITADKQDNQPLMLCMNNLSLNRSYTSCTLDF